MKKFSILTILILLAFVKVDIAQDHTQQVTAIQYFFNSDPGVGNIGNGDIITVTPDDTITQSFPLALPSLADGINHLYVRAKDEFGRWGLAERRSFFILQNTSTELVTALEYYFDSDPGTGNGTVQNIGSAGSYSGSLGITIPNTMSTGMHHLYIRSKDASGRWGLAERRSFFILQNTSTELVTALEYYFDSDPGTGNGTIQDIGPTGSYSGSLAITIPNTLNPGIHHLYIRSKDASGRWGLSERRSFYIQQVVNTELITALEYYYDSDPGVGNANAVEIAATPSVNGLYELGVPCLSTGTHYMYLRARDEYDRWSIIGRDTLHVTGGISPSVISPAGPVTFCPLYSVTLSIDSVPGILYQWQKDNVDIPGATASSLTIDEAGNYQVKAYCGDVFSTSNVVVASVLPLLTFYQDADNDGFGNASVDSLDCTQPVGYAANSTDCNDANANINPAATEICNLTDDDCDGSIDEGVQTTYFADADGDGFGNSMVTILACTVPAGYIDNDDDCDDTNASINPLATEICNLIDDDCDGLIDEEVQTTYYADSDSDGYGNPTSIILACTQPAGYVDNYGDCNDSDANINPDETELCNGIDDNCDGNTDEGFVYSVEGASISSAEGESFCVGTSTLLTVNGGILGTGAEWLWYEGGCGSGSSIGTGVSVSITPAAGIHTYFVRAEGICNNSACISIEITVNTPPAFTLCPADINTGNDVSLCSAIINYDVTATGSPAPTLAYVFTGATEDEGSGTGSGSSFSLGTTYVTVTATNICGTETCSFAVTVNDTEGPVLTGCPAPIDAEVEEGQWGAHVSWAPPTANDNCGFSNLISTHMPGAFFNVGSTVVIYTATDDAGNESTCQFYVTVTPPDLLGTVNVSVISSDITFSDNNPDPNSTVSVTAIIRNHSNINAGSFSVQMAELFTNTSYPAITVAGLNAGQSVTINQLIATPPVPSFVPVQITIDLLDDLDESNELDNAAVRPFVCGTLETIGTMGVSTNAVPSSVPAGSVIQICGSAYYENVTPPLDDPSVAGAELVITIEETGQQINGFTDENGNFCYAYITPNTPGLYHYTVDITDNTLGGDQSGTFTLSIPEYSCPTDLSVSLDLTGISPSSMNTYIIPAGTSFSGTVYVHNSCEAVSQPTTLFIGLPSGTPVPGPYTIPPLSPGETYDISLPTITMPIPGSFYISATVDYYNSIEESSESNNTVFKTLIILPLLPDVVVSGNVLSVLQCQPNNQVNFTVRNVGTVSTGSFNTVYNIYVNGTLQSSTPQSFTNLVPEEYVTLSFPFTPPMTDDTIRFEFIADIPDMVTELSEFNNNSDFSLVFQPCIADIIVLGCEYTDVKPADPMVAGSINVTATIMNVGQLPVTTPFTVNFNVAGNIISVPVPDPLAAQQSLTMSVISPVPVNECGSLSITADAGNVISESEEGNNTYSASLCYEFAFENIDCSGWPIFHGTQYYCNPGVFRIGYWNSGIYEATNLQVKFELSGPGLNGWIDLGTVTTYAANSCDCPGGVTLPNNFMYPQTGIYQVRMTLDPDNMYTELNEGNNVWIMNVNVVEGSDYEILSSYIAPSDINPDINENVSFNVSYTNTGCSGFNPVKLYTLVDNEPLGSLMVNPLTGGGWNTVAIPAQWSSSVPGVHVFRAIIDYDEIISEGNEMNNEATKAIIVGDAPDYNVTSVTASEMTPLTGQMLTLSASVLNEGQSTGSGLLQFISSDSYGSEAIISEQTISIFPGSTITVETSWITTDPHSRIIARVINVLPIEFDFSDNERQIQLNDLFVSLSASDVLCFGDNSGIISASITGGAEPYIIEWDYPGLSGETVNVPAGSYMITVTDFYGLSVSDDITVNEPPELLLTESHLDASCDNLSDGSIDLAVTGGTAPYTYLWNNGETIQDLSGLAAGTYTVTVTDDHNCSATVTVTLTNLYIATVWYQDSDNDGYGNNSATMMSCVQPDGFVSDNTDCNDSNAAINPGAAEVCNNNLDDNCNGVIDEGCCDITVDAGNDVTTYFGITSMQEVNRTAIVSGGTPPFTYSWTLGRPLLCNQIDENGDEIFSGGTCTNSTCPSDGSPSETASCTGSATISAHLMDTTNICVTVTDVNGCTATDCFTVNASDVRCFAGNSGVHKIKMCHHTNSNGNPWVEICVDTNAIDAHLAHGDYIGSCFAPTMAGIDEEEDLSLNLTLFPNPATRRVTLEFDSETDNSYNIDLADMTGRILAGYQGKASHGSNSRELSLEGIQPGIYLVALILDGKKEVKKLVIE